MAKEDSFCLLRSIPLRLSCLPICNCRSFDDEDEKEEE